MGNMVYARGSRYDYDNWASLGNVGWGYEDVLKYFKKSENFQSVLPRSAGENYDLQF